MFFKFTIKDLIELTPSQFYRPLLQKDEKKEAARGDVHPHPGVGDEEENDAEFQHFLLILRRQIREKYLGKILPLQGMVASIGDILQWGQKDAKAFLIPNTHPLGSAMVPVQFEVACFRPLLGEKLRAVITRQTSQGIHLSMHFFDSVFIPQRFLQKNSFFHEKLSVWYYVAEDDDDEGGEEEDIEHQALRNNPKASKKITEREQNTEEGGSPSSGTPSSKKRISSKDFKPMSPLSSGAPFQPSALNEDEHGLFPEVHESNFLEENNEEEGRNNVLSPSNGKTKKNNNNDTKSTRKNKQKKNATAAAEKLEYRNGGEVTFEVLDVNVREESTTAIANTNTTTSTATSAQEKPSSTSAGLVGEKLASASAVIVGEQIMKAQVETTEQHYFSSLQKSKMNKHFDVVNHNSRGNYFDGWNEELQKQKKNLENQQQPEGSSEGGEKKKKMGHHEPPFHSASAYYPPSCPMCVIGSMDGIGLGPCSWFENLQVF